MKEAGVHTSLGYSAVLRSFLEGEDVMLKINQWKLEDTEEEWDEKLAKDDTITTVATSWVEGLASSFTSRLHLNEEIADPHTISPLTDNSPVVSPLHRKRSVFSEYGPTRTHGSISSKIVLPLRTFPSLPFSLCHDVFDDSPTFGKKLVEFMIPRNLFNLNLEDETVVPKKRVPNFHKNLQSIRRASKMGADVAVNIHYIEPNTLSKRELRS